MCICVELREISRTAGLDKIVRIRSGELRVDHPDLTNQLRAYILNIRIARIRCRQTCANDRGRKEYAWTNTNESYASCRWLLSTLTMICAIREIILPIGERSVDSFEV